MRKSLFLVVILLVTGAAARADEVCPSATLADYVALGSCTIPYSIDFLHFNSSMTLSGFSYTPGSGAPLASRISVTSSIDIVGFPYCNQGFPSVCAKLNVSFGGFSTTTSLSGSLDFTAEEESGIPFHVAELSLAPDVVLADGASIAVQAALSNGVSLSTEVVNLPPPAGVDKPFSRVWFTDDEISSEVSVHDSFQANAGPSGSPTSFGFTNSLITPEPGTLGLLALGALGLGFWRRKKHGQEVVNRE